MKKDLHPTDYKHVVFEDLNDGTRILTRSTAKSDEKVKWEDGKEYPLIKVHISSSSHPFYTGQEKLVDVEGRVDRFKARTEAAKVKQVARSSKAKKAQQRQKTDGLDEIVQKVGGGPIKKSDSKAPKDSK
jgi:large subunit ribosomal protein L31